MTTCGDLRDRIELQAATEAADAAGQPIRTWATYATVWAQVVSPGGTEASTAGQQQAITRRVVTMRHRSDLAADHQIIWRGRTLNPQSVRDPDGLRRWLVAECLEREGAS